MLAWIADARAALVPAPRTTTDLLLDVACGGGLLAPRVSGYRHVGVDLSRPALDLARDHGVETVRGDVLRLPFADGTFAVVVAGEILEHVADHRRLVAEVCRVLEPGGTLIIDAIAATWWGRFSAITVGERIPAGPPAGLHDGALFVNRRELLDEAARHGVALALNGLRPSARDYLLWAARLKTTVRMIPRGPTAGLFQAVGTKTG